MREKDEWSFATMEYGGKHAQTIYGWDEVDANIICQRLGFNNSRALPTNDSHFGAGDSLVQLNRLSVSCIWELQSQCGSCCHRNGADCNIYY